MLPFINICCVCTFRTIPYIVRQITIVQNIDFRISSIASQPPSTQKNVLKVKFDYIFAPEKVILMYFSPARAGPGGFFRPEEILSLERAGFLCPAKLFAILWRQIW